jgi:hypothetical protein
MQQQLSQFYWAAALAVALNRVLVLPELACFCHNGGGGASELCRAPGDRTTSLPFACTADQVSAAQQAQHAQHDTDQAGRHAQNASARRQLLSG